MPTMPPRAPLDGPALAVELEVCPAYCLPFPHYHKAYGDAQIEYDFCAECHHFINDRHVQPNCTCSEDCHQAAQVLAGVHPTQ